jgi:hypothetical protein
MSMPSASMKGKNCGKRYIPAGSTCSKPMACACTVSDGPAMTSCASAKMEVGMAGYGVRFGGMPGRRETGYTGPGAGWLIRWR